jgi:hypothetical protein
MVVCAILVIRLGWDLFFLFLDEWQIFAKEKAQYKLSCLSAGTHATQQQLTNHTTPTLHNSQNTIPANKATLILLVLENFIW